MFNPLNKIWRLFRYVSKVCDYLGALWVEADWDYNGIFILMKKKLERLDFQIENGYHLRTEKDRRKMRTAIHILGRLIKREYAEDYYTRYEALRDKNNKARGITTIMGSLRRGATDEERRLLKHAVEVERELREADEDLLFKIIKTQYRGWWD